MPHTIVNTHTNGKGLYTTGKHSGVTRTCVCVCVCACVCVCCVHVYHWYGSNDNITKCAMLKSSLCLESL